MKLYGQKKGKIDEQLTEEMTMIQLSPEKQQELDEHILAISRILIIINEDEEFQNVELEKKVSITNHLIFGFPEDWQADLESQKERWIKQQYSSQKIKHLILKHLLHMIWIYIQIQIENIWLPKSSSTKEIE